MVTGDTISKVAACLSKLAVRTGSAAPEETKTAQEATGVHIDFEMLAETSYEETLNLRMASQDFPDIFSQSVAFYQQKPEKAIDEMTDVLRAFKDKYGTTNALLINSDLDSAAEYGLNFSAQGFKMYMGRSETAPALFITLVI